MEGSGPPSLLAGGDVHWGSVKTQEKKERALDSHYPSASFALLPVLHTPAHLQHTHRASLLRLAPGQAHLLERTHRGIDNDGFDHAHIKDRLLGCACTHAPRPLRGRHIYTPASPHTTTHTYTLGGGCGGAMGLRAGDNSRARPAPPLVLLLCAQPRDLGLKKNKGAPFTQPLHPHACYAPSELLEHVVLP
jgi:hypothetical protein